MLSVGAPAAAEARPNAGSPLGVNLHAMRPYGTEQPFVDVLRAARRWHVSGGQGDVSLELGPSGWPLRLPEGASAELPLFPGIEERMPPGVYVCLYEGRGALDFAGFDVVERAPGRIAVRPAAQPGRRALLLKATDPTDPIRNVRLVMPGFEATHERQPFHPSFLRRWERFSVLRFMDWMATNDSRIRSWSQRPRPEGFQGTERGVALEVMIDLANTLHAEPWFCIPHLADDDYVRQFARVVKERLSPDLRAWVEYSNEVWNGQFEQARYARRRGVELGLAEARREHKAGLHFTARRSLEIFRIFEQELGGTSRLVRVLAGQHSSPGRFRDLLTFEEAHRHADVYGVAPYFGGRLARREGDRLLAAGMEGLFAALREDLPVQAGLMRENARLAGELGLALVAYEGGQHLRGDPRREDLIAFLQAANRHPAMKELYLRYLTDWKQAGGRTFVHYSSTQRFNKHGSWGALEFPEPAAGEAPKYEALLGFIEANPRWWEAPAASGPRAAAGP